MLSKLDIAELGAGEHPNHKIYGANTSGLQKDKDGKPVLFLNRRQRRRSMYAKARNNAPMFRKRSNGKVVQIRNFPPQVVIDHKLIKQDVEDGRIKEINGQILGMYDDKGKLKKRYLKKIYHQ